MFPRILLNSEKICGLKAKNGAASSLLISLIGAGGKTTTAFWLAKQYKKRDLKVLLTTTTKMYLPKAALVDKIICLGSKQHIAQEAMFELANPQAGISFVYQNDLLSDPKALNQVKVLGLAPELIDRLKIAGKFDVILVEADGAHHKWLKCPADHEPLIPQQSDIVISVTGADVFNRPASPEIIHRWSFFSRLTACQKGQHIDLPMMAALIGHPQGMFKKVPTKAQCIWLINKVNDVNKNPFKTRGQFTSIQLRPMLDCHRQLEEIWLANMDIPVLYQVISP